jgi:dimeric dUTPase (all-alpha-NTP-PPase superfamily)
VSDLKKMFDMQRELNNTIIDGFDDIPNDTTEQMKWCLQFSRAMQDELQEFVNSFPWKWWSKNTEVDARNARIETIDMMHFVISMAQCLGMTHADFLEGFTMKNKINHIRQGAKYDHRTDKEMGNEAFNNMSTNCKECGAVIRTNPFGDELCSACESVTESDRQHLAEATKADDARDC